MSRLGIAVLGATGSVGRQALEVIAAFPERFRVVALAANRNVNAMLELVARHRPRVAALADPAAAEDLKTRLCGDSVEILAGPDEIAALSREPDVDILVAAIVGGAGLDPVFAAVQAGKTVALANKEALVMAGRLVMSEARAHGAVILPVDSEHAAAHQLLAGVDPEQVHKLILTASGGPFFGRPREELMRVTPEEALAHPNWNMGAKVSIDSASMMNKGFEIMEARWLFDLPPARIEVLVHPQSQVHAMLEMVDGSLLAQLARPDMRLSIAHALSFPGLLDLPGKLAGARAPDLTAVPGLTFHSAGEDSYPALRLCRRALEGGGGLPAVLSVADEVAVAAFLEGRIRFTEITDILARVLDAAGNPPADTIEDIKRAGCQGAELAKKICAKFNPS
ncbi:MAG TPA: 1-deoxy-D-xylulose-5-phosphate reductoisomerase [Myxococcota bacterium]|nr:1-deoxy-D-xylulose-5-phosphate reductoisomerase [Myxococcota bacterium]